MAYVGRNPPPPHPSIVPWVAARHGPLNLHENINHVPDNYLKLLCKYNV